MRLPGLAVLLLFLSTITQADPLGPRVVVTEASTTVAEAAAMNSGPLVVWIAGGIGRANGHFIAASPVRIAVASRGDEALVAWTQSDGTVMAVRVRPDGTTSSIARAIGSQAAGPIAVAASRDRYFVTWVGTFGEIYATIAGTPGVPIIPAMPITTQSPSTISEIRAAASETGFAAVWHLFPEYRVLAATVDENGVPPSMDPMVLSDYGAFADVTSNGQRFFAAWGNGSFISARTFTAAGELGPTRRVTDGVAPRVTWDGHAYSMAYVKAVQPRPGFSFYVLMALRVLENGAAIERLYPQTPILPGLWDVDARGGRLDLVYSSSGLNLQSAIVGEEHNRTHAVRH